MSALIKKFQEYLNEILALQISVQKWQKTHKLPLVLREEYEYYETSIHNQACILLVPRNSEGASPARISKHIGQVEKIHLGLPILIQEFISPFNRRRLIQHNVPFVVPGNQMYLPFLGLDLREHFKKMRNGRRDGLTPSAQALLIWLLHQEARREFSANRLSHILGYSAMTITRAFDELDALSIVEIRKAGRHRISSVPDRKNLIWNEKRDYLLSPVRDRRYLSRLPQNWDGPFAGVSALAGYTSIAEPRIPVYACTYPEWKLLIDRDGVDVLPEADTDAVELELWSYSPRLAPVNGCVDSLSLFLSLQVDSDDRLEMALHELVGRFPW